MCPGQISKAKLMNMNEKKRKKRKKLMFCLLSIATPLHVRFCNVMQTLRVKQISTELMILIGFIMLYKW